VAINDSFVKFAKLLIESPKFGCSTEMLTIVAMLSGKKHATNSHLAR
jgi:HrpA-like RNA helicase